MKNCGSGARNAKEESSKVLATTSRALRLLIFDKHDGSELLLKREPLHQKKERFADESPLHLGFKETW